MTWERIATIDEVHTELFREAFSDASIPVRFQSLGAIQQAQLQRLVTRAMVDVEVDSTRRAEAEALLAELSTEGEKAALAEAETMAPPDDANQSTTPLWRRGLRWLSGGKD